MARTRLLPSIDDMEPSAANMVDTWPPISSVSETLAPLYGMCTMSVLVRALKNSMARWVMAPVPEDP